MGINGLLPKVLPSAGRENFDLNALSHGLISPVGERRKFRIAVDVNGWIARAAHGHGTSLMDERHLSYHGRAELRHERSQAADGENTTPVDDEEFQVQILRFVLQRIESMRQECCAFVLPVLDGASPPCKWDAVRQRSDRRERAAEERDEMAQSPQKPAAGANIAAHNRDTGAERGGEAARTEAEVLRRISASKRAGTGNDDHLRQSITGKLLKEFRKRGWPFLVAPYEADGQLAYLAGTGAVDVVVTEDSDLIALGVPTLVYKLGGWNGRNAANRAGGGPDYFGSLRENAARNLRGTVLRRCDLGASQGIDLMDFSDAMLATMFVAAGCDYCDSLKGIGVVTARNIVKRAFHGGEANEAAPSSEYSDHGVAVLKVVLSELFQSCAKEARAQVMPLDDPEKEEVRLEYESSFLAAIAMFRHPLVYDPILGMHAIANDVCDDGHVRTPASVRFLKDEEILLEYPPYRELVTRREKLYQVIGAPFAPEMAKDIAEGVIDPRQLPMPGPRENGLSESAPYENSGVVRNKNQPDVHGEHGQAESRNHNLGNSRLQLSSQDVSGAGTQQSKAQSTATSTLASQDFHGAGTQQSKASSLSGMVSSLSPDLLASPEVPV